MTIVYRGSGVAAYLDGQIISQVAQWGTVSAVGLQNSGSPFVIGATESFSGRFSGSLDELRIYRRALSAIEVGQLYASESTSASGAPPSVSTHPVGQSLLVGQPLQLSVVASGAAPLTYQWLRNGNVLAGATTASYAVPNATAADAGTYSVLVQNSLGSIYSNQASVTVSASGQALSSGLLTHITFDSSLTRAEPVALQATLNGGLTSATDRFGRAGFAAGFDGIDDAILFNIPDLPRGATSRTLSLWALSTPKSGATLVGLAEWGSAAGRRTYGISAQFAPQVYQAKSYGGGNDLSSTQVADAVWRHLVSTYENGLMRIYVDGIPKGEMAITLDTGPGDLRVGVGVEGGNYFSGQLDDLRIYSRALSASEVSQLYAQEAAAVSNAAPAVSTHPAARTLLVGQPLQLSVTVSGAAPLAYQWLRNGVVLAGATTATYGVASVAAADAGSYAVRVTNSFGSVTSSAATVDVAQPQPQAPVFTLQPASIAAPTGSSRSFSVMVTGYPAPALQWMRNGVRLSGENRETLTLANISSLDAGAYACEATNSVGTALSQVAILSVGQAPLVAKAPPISEIEVRTGDPLRIDLPPVVGTGPYTYVWTRDGTPIAGAGPVLQIGALNLGDGGLYSCTVANEFGRFRIDRVRVSMVEVPRISVQPQSATIQSSGSVTFRVAASGNPAPVYQWYRNEVPLNGQTAAQLAVAGTPATQAAGGYHCVVSNRAGIVRSATAWLTIGPVAASSPSITRPVQLQEVGRSVQLVDSDPVFVAGFGQVFASYSTFSASGIGTDRNTAGALFYNNELRPRAGSVRDYEANYVRRTPLGYVDYGNFVISLPTGDSDGNGINDAFDYRQNGTVTAQGSGYDFANGLPFSIELRFVRNAGQVRGRYAARTRTPLGDTAEVSGDFYLSGPNGVRVGSTSYVRGASNVMSLSLAPDPAVAGNYGTPYTGNFSFTVPDRDTVAYSAFDLTSNNGARYAVRAGTLKRAGASFGGILSYVDGRVGTAFADYVSTYLTITDPSDSDGDGIPDLSDDLPSPPVLLSFSGTARVLAPGEHLDLAATSSAPATFVWKRDGIAVRTSLGTTSDSFSIPSVASSDSGTYSLEISNGGGTASSALIPIVVNVRELPPVITVQPEAAQLALGSNLILTVDANAGTAPRFQWRKDGIDIPGATGSSYGRVSLNSTEAGYYSVVVTNSAGSTISQLASVAYASESSAAASLSNLSVRTQMRPSAPLIVGAVVSGTGKPLLMRSAGPALENFGLRGVLESEIILYGPSQNVLARRQGWERSLAAIFPLVGAFPFAEGSKDSALLRSMRGSFTLHTSATSVGTALVELYDASGGAGPRVVNLSVRNRVGTDSDILIVGLAVGGSGRMNLLIRAVGPTLAAFGVGGALQDPVMTIYDPSGSVVAANDNWSSELISAFAKVGAFGLPAGSRDSALLLNAIAGAVYTVHVAGLNDSVGEALVEVYEVN